MTEFFLVQEVLWARICRKTADVIQTGHGCFGCIKFRQINISISVASQTKDAADKDRGEKEKKAGSHEV